MPKGDTNVALVPTPLADPGPPLPAIVEVMP